MLLGQQRGGGEHGHLAAGAGGHVGSAQGHLGLAEAHVAADQAVHRLGRDQILHDGMDGSLLVRRFLEAEALGEGRIAGRVELEGMSGPGGAAGIEIQQLDGDVTRLLGRLAARLVPLAGAQRVQRGILGRGARVAADEVQHGHWHVQGGIVGVGQVQEFGGAFTQVDVDQPHVAPDAMLGMDDRVARLEFGQVADEGVDLSGLPLVALALAHEGGEQLAFGDDQQLAVHKAEAPLQRADGEHHGGIRRHRGLPVFGGGHLQAGFGKEFLQCLASAQRFGNDQAPLGSAGHGRGGIQHVAQGADGIVLAAVDRHVGHSDSMDGAYAPAISPGFTPFGARCTFRGIVTGGTGIRELVTRCSARGLADGGLRVGTVCRCCRNAPCIGRDGGQRETRKRLAAHEELLGREKQFIRRERRALGVVADEVEALAGIGTECLQLALHVAMQDDLGIFGQVIEEGGRLVEEKRQVVFDAAGGDTVADVTVQGHTRGIAVEALAPAAPEGRACRFVQRELAAGQQLDGLDRIQAALGVGVEGAQAVQFVVEEVQPVGQRRAHREQVDEATAHRVFTGAQHLLDMLVAGQRELGLQGSFVQLHALGELEGARGQPRGRRQPVRGRAGSHQQHVQLAPLQAIQGGKPLGDQILVGRQAVVGQGFPVGQPGDGQ